MALALISIESDGIALLLAKQCDPELRECVGLGRGGIISFAGEVLLGVCH